MSNRRVHFDGVLFSGDSGISIIDHFVDPILESLSSESENAVGDISPRELVNFARDNWKNFHDILDSVFAPLQHLVN